MNYSDKAISKWERADSIPDAYILLKISELFGVSVEYMFVEHSEQDKKVETKPQRRNKRLIANIVTIGITAIALLAFIILAIKGEKYYWEIFIYAIPAIMISQTVLSFVWFKGKLAFAYISGIVWSILATVYFAVGDYSSWMMFLLGIPAQIIIILCFNIKISIKISQKEHTSKKVKIKNKSEKEENEKSDEQNV